ncbi:MAG TPA: LysR family transcriptional regulator, partial [Albitalea sp.]|nr:LysR family transcriptional regulator [Albitalea sp.]
MGIPSGIELHDLEILEAVAQEGNFSVAARALSLSRADVSRTVARLEQRLDVRLCTRTTRRVALTDAGRDLVRRLRPALHELSAALEQVSEQQHRFSGPIRVACSHAFGRHFLVDEVTRFVAAHPAVEVNLTLNDRIEDLVLSALDLALRIGPLAPSSMVARKLGRLPLALVAAPELCDSEHRFTPKALGALPAIGFRVPGSGDRYPWRLRLGAQDVPIAHEKVSIESDSIEAVADLARLGAG